MQENLPPGLAAAIAKLLENITIVRDTPAPNEPLVGFDRKPHAFYDYWEGRFREGSASHIVADTFEFIGKLETPQLGDDPPHEHLNIHYKISRLQECARAVLNEAHAANLSPDKRILIDAEVIAPQISEIKEVLTSLKEKMDELTSAQTTFANGVSFSLGPINVTLAAMDEAIASARQSIVAGVQYNALALSATLARFGSLANELVDQAADISSDVRRKIISLIEQITILAARLAQKGVEIFDEIVRPRTDSEIEVMSLVGSSFKAADQPSKADEVAFSMGTSNTVIVFGDRGLVLREPTIAIVRKSGGRRAPVAIGRAAAALIGRTPRELEVVRPVKDGVVVDTEVAAAIAKQLLAKVRRSGFLNPTILATVPCSAHSVERRAIHECALSVGARKVFLIEKLAAAAIGAGLEIHKPGGFMVVHLGGGLVEAGVFALDGIVFSRSVRAGGNHLNDAIAGMLRRELDFEVGWLTLERLKCELGQAPQIRSSAKSLIIRGSRSRVPAEVVITQEMVVRAISSNLSAVAEMLKQALEAIPAEIAGDIVDRGIVLTGGGALLPGIDGFLSDETGLHCLVAEGAMNCVGLGLHTILSNLDQKRHLLAAKP